MQIFLQLCGIASCLGVVAIGLILSKLVYVDMARKDALITNLTKSNETMRKLLNLP